MHAHIHPSSTRFTIRLAQGAVSIVYKALSPRMVSSCRQSLYRESLRLRASVTSSQHGILPVSPGITPALSLIRTHAPDQNPLTASVLPLYYESLQVAARPCWKLALPDVILRIFLSVLGPIPPPALLVHLPISSQETTAFPMSRVGRRYRIFPTATSVRFGFSGLQSFDYLQAR